MEEDNGHIQNSKHKIIIDLRRSSFNGEIKKSKSIEPHYSRE